MEQVTYIVYAFVLLKVLSVAQFNSGDYRFEIQRILTETKNVACPFYSTWRKYNLNGNITLTTSIDETARIRMEIQKWGDGGWKTFANVTKEDPCKLYRLYFRGVYSHIMKATKVNAADECPVTARTYIWRDYIIDTESFRENFLIGDFNVRFTIRKDNVVIYGTRMYFKTIQLYPYK